MPWSFFSCTTRSIARCAINPASAGSRTTTWSTRAIRAAIPGTQKTRRVKAVTLGPLVKLDRERCILCTRCVRFTRNVTKTGEIGVFNQRPCRRDRHSRRETLRQSLLRQRRRYLSGRRSHEFGLSLQGPGVVSQGNGLGLRRLQHGLQSAHRSFRTRPGRRHSRRLSDRRHDLSNGRAPQRRRKQELALRRRPPELPHDGTLAPPADRAHERSC